MNNNETPELLPAEKKERFAKIKKVGKRLVHVLNPVSGSSRYYEAAKKTVEEIGGDMIVSKSRGNITELVKDALNDDPTSHLVVYGGDGSLYEAMNGVMESGAAETAEISVIPSGSGNDFATWANNGNSLPKGEPHKIDLIKVTCGDRVHYFDNMMNIGFDCSVVSATESLRKSGMFKGPSAYLAGVAKTLAVKQVMDAELTLSGCVDLKTGEPTEDYHIKKKLLLVGCANGQYCGGGFRYAPLSALDNGLMDVLVVSDVTRLKFVSLVGDFRKGTHIDENGVLKEAFRDVMRYKRCSKMVISGPTEYCLDGEIFPVPNGQSVTVEVVHNAVNFVAI